MHRLGLKLVFGLIFFALLNKSTSVQAQEYVEYEENGLSDETVNPGYIEVGGMKMKRTVKSDRNVMVS